MVTVYWVSGSPMAWPIQLALLEKEIPHDSVMLEFSRGDNRTAQFLAMNPRGKVPVLRDGETCVYEARAIMDYLETRFPALSLLPADPADRVTDLIRKHETSYIYPAADAAISYTSYSSTLRREQWDHDELVRLAEPLVHEFARWDAYLTGRDWLAGGAAPTQSDLFLIPQVLYMRRFGFDYRARGFSHLDRYCERVSRRPSVRATWPPHWQQSEGDPTFAQDFFHSKLDR